MSNLEALSSLGIIGADELFYDATPTWFKKATEAKSTLEEKLIAADQLNIKKTATMDGYAEYEVEPVDGDTIRVFKGADDTKGTLVRLASPLQKFDAVDDVSFQKQSFFKTKNQPEFITKLTGIDFNSLSPEEQESLATNVKNYHTQQLAESLTNPEYKFTPYNNNIQYDVPTNSRTKALLKITGQSQLEGDTRPLASVINPNTKRELSWDMANNPYLNSAYSMYTSIDNQKNREILAKYSYNSSDISKKFNSFISDHDDRFEEMIDVFQSSAIQAAARFLSTDVAESLGFDKQYWSQIANPETGQAIADAWAGVRPDTRREIASEMLKASKAFRDGRYAEAITTWASNLDSVLAESMVSGLEFMAGNAAVAGSIALISQLPFAAPIAGALGAGVVTRTGLSVFRALLSAGLFAGTDQTIQDIEAYKAQHHGADMSSEDIARSWILNTFALAPDALLTGTGLSRLLPKSVQKVLTGTEASFTDRGIIKDTAISTLKSGIAEGIQEPIQNAISEANVMGADNLSEFGSNLLQQFQGDNLYNRAEESILGAMAGGALEGSGRFVSNVKHSIAKPFTSSSDVEISDSDIENTGSNNTISNVSEQFSEIANSEIYTNPNNFTVNEVVDTVNKLADIISEQPEEDQNALYNETFRYIYRYIDNLDVSKEEDVNNLKKLLNEIDYTYNDKDNSFTKDIDKLLFNLAKNSDEVQDIISVQGSSKIDDEDESSNAVKNFLDKFVKADIITGDKANSIAKSVQAYHDLSDGRLSTDEVAEEATTSSRSHGSYYNKMKEMLDKALEATTVEQKNGYAKEYTRWQGQADRFILAQMKKHLSMTKAATELVSKPDFSENSTIEVPQGVDRYGKQRTLRLSGKNLKLHYLGKSFASIYNNVYNHTKKAIKDQIELLEDLKKTNKGPIKKDKIAERLKMLKSLYNRLEKQNKEYNRAVSFARKTLRTTNSSTDSDASISEDISAINNEISDESLDSDSILDSEGNDITDSLTSLTDRREELRSLRGRVERVTERATRNNYTDALKYAELSSKIDTLFNKVLERIDELEKKYEEKELEANKTRNRVLREVLKSIPSLSDKVRAKILKKTLLPEKSNTRNTSESTGLKEVKEAIASAEELININTQEDIKETSEPVTEESVHETNEKAEEPNQEYTDGDANTSLEIYKGEVDGNYFKGNRELRATKVLTKAINNPNLWKGFDSNKIREITSATPVYERYVTNSEAATSNIYDFIDGKLELSEDQKELAENLRKMFSSFSETGSMFNAIDSSYNGKAKITFNLDKDLDLSRPNSPHCMMLKSYAFSDAMQFIYDFNIEDTPRGNVGTFSINPYVAAAAYMAFKDYIANRTSLDKYSPDEACRIFGANPDTTSAQEKNRLLQRLLVNGTPLSSVANTIGTTMVEYLGIQPSDKSNIFDYDGLKSALGLFAVKAFELGLDKKEQFVTIQNVKPSKEDIKNGIETNVPHVKFNINAVSKGFKTEYESFKRSGLLKEAAIESTRPRFSIRKSFKDYGYKGIPKSMEQLNSFQQKSLEAQCNTPYELNKGIVELILKSKFNPKEYDALRTSNDTKGIMDKLHSWDLGYLLDFSDWQDYTLNSDGVPTLNNEFVSTHSYNDSVSQLGVNSSIEKEILGLLDTYMYTFKDMLAKQYKKEILSKEVGELPKEVLRKRIQDKLTRLGFTNIDHQSEFYFDRFQSKNGRTMIKGTLINPQANKYIQRFLIQNKLSNRVEFNPEDKDMRNEEAYAIAQAFDALGHNNKVRALRDYFDSLIKTGDSYDVAKAEKLREDFLKSGKDFDSFKKKYGFVDSKDIGIENFGQCILVMNHLVAKAKANGGKFNTYLAVENDSTTSGFAIKYFAFPDESLVKNGLYEKVGAIFNGKPVDNHTLKKSEGFLDTYKDSAKGMYRELFSDYFSNHKELDNKYIEKIFRSFDTDLAHSYDPKKKKVFRSNHKDLMEVFKYVSESFPILDENGNVTSKIRNLIKPVTMIFGYSAGEKKLQERMGESIYTELIKNYMSVKGNTKSLKPSMALLFKKLEKAYKDANPNSTSLYEALLTNDDDDILIKLDGVTESLRDSFLFVLGGTYGGGLTLYLKDKYEHILKANKQMINAITIANNIFYEALGNELEKAGYSNTGNIPTDKFNEIIYNLKQAGIFPQLNLIYDETKGFIGENGLFLGDWGTIFSGTHEQDKGSIITRDNPFTTTFNNKGQRVASMQGTIGYKDKKTNYFVTPYVASKVKSFKPGGLGQAVETIHSIDGMIMQIVQSIYPNITSIYDAVEQNALGHTNTSKMYNAILPYVAYNMNLPAQMFDLVTSMSNNYRDRYGRNYGSTYKNKNSIQTERAFYRGGTYLVSRSNGEAEERTVEREDSLKGWAEDSANSREAFIRSYPEFYSANFDGMNAYSKVSLKDSNVILSKLIDGIFAPRAVEEYAKESKKHEENITIQGSSAVNNRNRFFHKKHKTFAGEKADILKTLKDMSIRSDDKYLNLLSKDNATVEDRIRLLDYFQELSTRHNASTVSQETIDHYKDIFSKFTPESLTGFSVFTLPTSSNNGLYIEKSKGSSKKIVIGYESKDKRIVDYYDKIAKKSLFSDGALASIYAHEMIHAATTTGIKNASTFGVTDKVKAIQKLRNYCIKNNIITVDTFKPKEGTYDPKNKAIIDKIAKDMYSYISSNTEDSLCEFVAHGLTNTSMMEALKNHTLKEERTTLFKKLTGLFKDMLGNMFNVSKWKNESKDLESELIRLAVDLNNNANKTIDRYDRESKIYGSSYDMTRSIYDAGNSILKPIINTVTDVDDKLGLDESSFVVTKPSKFAGYTNLLKTALAVPFSASARRMLASEIRTLSNMHKVGLLSTLMDEAFIADRDTHKLNNLNALSRNIDNMKKSMESITKLNLIDAFERPLTDLEATSLTSIGLMCDLQVLYNDKSSINTIREYVTNEESRAARINELENELKVLDKHNATFAKNMSKALAKFMITNIGTVNLMTNPRMIADTVHLDDVKILDELISLYALDYSFKYTMSPEAKDSMIYSFNNLSDKGLNQFFAIAKEHEKENTYSEITTAEGQNKKVYLYDKFNKVKGKYKPLYNEQCEYIRGWAEDEEKLKAQGYTLIYRYKDVDVDLGEDCLYQKVLNSPSRVDGATWIYDTQYKIGNSLRTEALREDRSLSLDDFESLKYRFSNKVSKLNTLMYSRDLSYNNLDSIASDEVPKYYYDPKDESIKVSDIMLCTPTKVMLDTVGMNTNGIDVLSSMMAKQVGELNASSRNASLFHLLKQESYKMNPDSHLLRPEYTPDGVDNKLVKFKKITPDSNEKYIRDFYASLPSEIKSYIAKDENQNYKLREEERGLWIREDWLLKVFGGKQISLANSDFLRHNKNIQTVVEIAEDMLRTVSFLAKNNIVIKVPSVLLGNIISNIAYSLSEGRSVIDVFKMYKENTKLIDQYVKDKKAYDIINQKVKTNTASSVEKAKLDRLEKRITESPIHPLIKKGMFQSIVEDVRLTDIEAPSKFIKKFTESSVAKATPEGIKKVLNNLYMNQGTPVYSYMYKATQYSDFVARATEYRLTMDEAAKKYGKDSKEYKKIEEETTNRVWDVFINYDLPSHPVEQYLNDIGLVMFTKFAKRIQPVIAGNLKDDPMKVLTTMALQSVVHDVDDIYDQNIFNKDFSALVHNPIDNAITAVVPMPIQFATGMKKLI